MESLKAQVKNGRLILDVPTDLPDGTELELQPVDQDDLEPEERAELVAALQQSTEEAKAGQHRPAREFLDELRRRR